MNPQDNIENLDVEYIEDLEKSLVGNDKERFYHGNFTDVAEGALYGKELLKAEKDNRIKEGSIMQYFEKDPLYESTIGKSCLLPINF